MGYDLLNEPIATFFNADEFNPYLEPVYKQLTAAIRTVDKNHILFIGGAQWDSNFKIFGKPFDSKLVYTFHKYWTEPTQNVIQDYIDFRDKNNVPIYCGETGGKTKTNGCTILKYCSKKITSAGITGLTKSLITLAAS